MPVQNKQQPPSTPKFLRPRSARFNLQKASLTQNHQSSGKHPTIKAAQSIHEWLIREKAPCQEMYVTILALASTNQVNTRQQMVAVQQTIVEWIQHDCLLYLCMHTCSSL